jgi:hypothetical protein
LYEQGYTISGARAHLKNDNTKEDSVQAKQLIHKMTVELEDILELLN